MAKKKEEIIEEVYGTVTGGYPLNIRAEKSLDAAVVGQLQDGEKVKIVKAGKQWIEIEKGFVKADFIVM